MHTILQGSALSYARLPDSVHIKAIEQRRKVTVNGQLVFTGPVQEIVARPSSTSWLHSRDMSL